MMIMLKHSKQADLMTRYRETLASHIQKYIRFLQATREALLLRRVGQMRVCVCEREREKWGDVSAKFNTYVFV